jgi:hypothetical protein
MSGDVTNKGNASWQQLASERRRRGPARTQASRDLEAAIRTALHAHDDGTTQGVWIDPVKGEPWWIGSVASEAGGEDDRA